MKYTVDYFINKFEAIDEENWYTGRMHNDFDCYEDATQFCALGLCGFKETGEETTEGIALIDLFVNKMPHNNNPYYRGQFVTDVNDNKNSKYPQSTPKARILAALNDIKQRG